VNGWRDGIWSQFGAAIDMLENAIDACPDALWGDPTRPQPYWYMVYHTLFWLDLYLSNAPEGFAPPAPFTLSELEDGVMPDRVYSKDELRTYLEHGREKCRRSIAELTDEAASTELVFWSARRSTIENLLYNLRHVQHHTAQLNLILRQTSHPVPKWVSKAKSALADRG